MFEIEILKSYAVISNGLQ